MLIAYTQFPPADEQRMDLRVLKGVDDSVWQENFTIFGIFAIAVGDVVVTFLRLLFEFKFRFSFLWRASYSPSLHSTLSSL